MCLLFNISTPPLSSYAYIQCLYKDYHEEPIDVGGAEEACIGMDASQAEQPSQSAYQATGMYVHDKKEDTQNGTGQSQEEDPPETGTFMKILSSHTAHIHPFPYSYSHVYMANVFMYSQSGWIDGDDEGEKWVNLTGAMTFIDLTDKGIYAHHM